MHWYPRLVLVLTRLLNSFPLAASVSPEVSAAPLLGRFAFAMHAAERHMSRSDGVTPRPYENGGGCYTAFGHVNRQEYLDSLAYMPFHNLNPHDILDGPQGPMLTLEFHRNMPKVWKGANNCVIGVSLYDRPMVKGLYPHFRDAASLIIDKCAARGIGGLVRFSHFEVIVFDEAVLPGQDSQPILEFSRQRANIPFSEGLRRWWDQRNRAAVQQGIITPAANHAPFVCAGAPTTYAGLKDNINPSDIALILGIGGLGHLAVQFAAKMGVQVAVLSVIATEEAEARSFGASEGYFLSEAEKVTKLV